ncbi:MULTISPECIES: Spx/MgsR family RNA polymerase-binding regulatory protein [Breznakia]|uniref:Regulatory protein spx n=1 Tax=Breznakia blatticola TaxID=1754012 RepID=A0A4R7ZPF6_9FIRM|nr:MULTISPECIES: Spx/MgsR family RNA polymerase-binding regulatory protein [Breznakia]MDH6367630.1 regulatory protein spx [Breznakia sp. PH1-1]MDH6403980.1 regulatory protein spx [Breznakia sp. PF1-11]MDH6411689.1 regulatory protein spx [Breznakia sp. PFB1-11]MDH6414759.1 regulatory protein spx [Breznakia sp. PFB1-14]MDH6416040.1 regulatory protein spx [Breznakia sp. PFB1-4]
MILMYTSFGCTSAIKAKAWLKENNLNFVEKNIQSTLLNKEEIKYLLQRCPNGTDDIISTRSKAFKTLGKDIDDLTVNDLVNFIQENPTVLKRPILLDHDSFVVGFDNDEITAFVPSETRNVFGNE